MWWRVVRFRTQCCVELCCTIGLFCEAGCTCKGIFGFFFIVDQQITNHGWWLCSLFRIILNHLTLFRTWLHTILAEKRNNKEIWRITDHLHNCNARAKRNILILHSLKVWQIIPASFLMLAMLLNLEWFFIKWWIIILYQEYRFLIWTLWTQACNSLFQDLYLTFQRFMFGLYLFYLLSRWPTYQFPDRKTSSKEIN